MKNSVSVILTVYNYEDYVREAIESVLNQLGVDIYLSELVIVNDGSIDKSIDIINEYGNRKSVKIVNKRNEGQLSAFNSGFKHCNGQIICFLDADDIYYNTYISTISNYYMENASCDALFVRREYFGNDNFVEKSKKDEDFGYTVFSSKYLKEWVGSSTSAFSIKRETLNKILPLSEIETEWKVRADDCLVWGSSLVGARKHYINDILIKYRTHENNNNYNNKFTIDYLYKRNLSINKMFNIVMEKNIIRLDEDLFYLEFKSKSNKLKNLYKYIKILTRVHFDLVNKIVLIISIIKLALGKRPIVS